VGKIIRFDSLLSNKASSLSESVPKRFEENLKNLNISAEEWKQACVKQPSLLYQLPETINQNLEGACKLLGISKAEYLKAALKGPSLFTQSPETINQNIVRVCELLNINKTDYVKAALKRPQLFVQSPETINQNIEEVCKLLGITKAEYVKAALKAPSLFSFKPKSVHEKYKILKIIFGSDEATQGAVLTNPNLLNYAPERTFLHHLLREVFNVKTNLTANPYTTLKKLWQGTPEDLEKLIRILEAYAAQSKAERRTKKDVVEEDLGEE
jgi:hypothetical protein